MRNYVITTNDSPLPRSLAQLAVETHLILGHQRHLLDGGRTIVNHNRFALQRGSLQSRMRLLYFHHDDCPAR